MKESDEPGRVSKRSPHTPSRHLHADRADLGWGLFQVALGELSEDITPLHLLQADWRFCLRECNAGHGSPP
jgi:hypothetical protein